MDSLFFLFRQPFPQDRGMVAGRTFGGIEQQHILFFQYFGHVPRKGVSVGTAVQLRPVEGLKRFKAFLQMTKPFSQVR